MSLSEQLAGDAYWVSPSAQWDVVVPGWLQLRREVLLAHCVSASTVITSLERIDNSTAAHSIPEGLPIRPSTVKGKVFQLLFDTRVTSTMDSSVKPEAGEGTLCMEPDAFDKYAAELRAPFTVGAAQTYVGDTLIRREVRYATQATILGLPLEDRLVSIDPESLMLTHFPNPRRSPRPWLHNRGVVGQVDRASSPHDNLIMETKLAAAWRFDTGNRRRRRTLDFLISPKDLLPHPL